VIKGTSKKGMLSVSYYHITWRLWILKQCDLNIDVEIDSTAQLTFPDIQLKSADRVFRLYVKVIKDKSYCRGEESLTLNQVQPEALDNINTHTNHLRRKLTV
jgi:hypothetical protein